MVLDILLVSVFLLALAYLFSQRRPANFPPGPYGLPILGNLHQLGKTPYLLFQNEWKQKYGPIIGLYFGSFRTVAISDYKLIRKALLDPALSGRPNIRMFCERAEDVVPRGLLFTQDQESMDQRKFTSKQLKEFGLGNKSMENVIMDEVVDMTAAIAKGEGQPIQLKERFHIYTLNILWFIVAGQKCEEDQAILAKLFAECSKIMEENNLLSALSMFIPWFSKYFPTLSGFNHVNGQLVPLRNFLKKHIDEHKIAQANQPDTQHDYIGAYLNEILKTTDPASSFYKDVGVRSLKTSLIDLFFAGTESTANTVHWACLYMAAYPQVQEKLFEEIDEVVGKSRMPCLNDEPNMIYTQAFIQEVLRKSTITPLSIFHNTLKNIDFEGYKIPKDTMILLNSHGAHHDKEYWGDPEVIRPERFIADDSDGKRLIKHEAFFPFSLGRRSCPGIELAKNELFLYLSNIVQQFEIKPDSLVPVDLEPIVSMVLLPKPTKLVFSKRPGLGF